MTEEPTLKDLVDGFIAFQHMFASNPILENRGCEPTYWLAYGVAPYHTSQETLQRFVHKMRKAPTPTSHGFHRTFGPFLSALINKSSPERIAVNVFDYSHPPHDIGCCLRKKDVYVTGDVSSSGEQMYSGRLTIDGNVLLHAGTEMLGGEHIVKGDAYSVGSGAHQGTIFIKGNVLDSAGADNIQADIGIHGDFGARDHYGSLAAKMRGGSILVRGRCYADVGPFLGSCRIGLGQGEYTINISESVDGAYIYILGTQVFHWGKQVAEIPEGVKVTIE